MGNMRFKVGDRVRIKSLDWYNENKDEFGNFDINEDFTFYADRSRYCGKVFTISAVFDDSYLVKEDNNEYFWVDEMIEGLVEEENKPEPKFKVGDILCYRGETSGFLKVEEIREENGEIRYYETSRNLYLIENHPDVFVDKVCSVDKQNNLGEVNTLKIQSDNMETETDRGYYTTEPETTSEGKKRGVVYFWDNDFADKVELDLSDRELIQEDGKWFVVKKKKEYPKTYEECYKIMGVKLSDCYIQGYKSPLLEDLQELLICRDAYWKIAGEEMGLGKPWKNGRCEVVYGICRDEGNIIKVDDYWGDTHVFEFPIREMRDAFYDNFKELIKQCKELL